MSSSQIFTSSEDTDYNFDLGNFGRNISTSSPAAQIWFDRGLTWVYTFNHMEAVYCFKKAISCDPSCAMAYWGIAFAYGPNYNHPYELFDEVHLKSVLKETYHASTTAKSLASSATPIEQALIDAINIRFQHESLVPVDQLIADGVHYSDAMRSAYERFGDDLDVACLYADSMMTLTPWKLYDLNTGEPAEGARTVESREVLERALARQDALQHPGLLHMYIHLSEMSPVPERGLSAADSLRDLIPDAGHAHHMPIHLDNLIGDYRRAISSNIHATLADEKYYAHAGGKSFYSLYRLHNYHSLIYAAMFAGKKRIALETVDRMEATIPEDILRAKSPNLADWLEGFVGVRFHVMVRFGMWEEIINTQPPSDSSLYCVTTATLHYAKGVAYASLGRVKEAEWEQARYLAAIERVPDTRRTHPNRSVDILRVGVSMLDGEIKYRRGDHCEGLAMLRHAIHLEDNLVFSEPWGWMQPVRHAYAALSLEQGNLEEAAEAYKEDLGLGSKLYRAHHHPNNVWALQGYYECLTRMGQNQEASFVKPQLTIALAVADVPVKSSCFCRLDTSDVPNICVPPSCCK
ncbi:unnamed protein product [Penicillium salamii]|uniref:TPR domain protein n=1 Tax=Penicillium salamii TaxID=1612424 RepID=A0A9W4IXP1_9EURO|nr:unnamed protein product [Penicillium salamii]CAG8306447.1 unnamed protein product [Penicillium salamii]CAG8319485.1 unnamed protein product [Penicillium salamii]CAG8351224.1 unnamed protein product [Penicillium salamii]CAG8359326.1 unnamed protein product [Penicillium salamii]